MKFQVGGGSNFQNPEPGSYSCVLIRLIDLGSQEVTWQGATKLQHKIKFVWELSEKMEDGRPFIVMRDFTAGFYGDKGLQPFLESWRGSKFAPEDLKKFNAKDLIGKCGLISLVQNGEYVNVASLSRLPKGMEGITPVNPLVYFSLAEFDQSVFDSLSDKIKEKIMLSPEYKILKGEGKAQDEFDPEDDSLTF